MTEYTIFNSILLWLALGPLLQPATQMFLCLSDWLQHGGPRALLPWTLSSVILHPAHSTGQWFDTHT